MKNISYKENNIDELKEKIQKMENEYEEKNKEINRLKETIKFNEKDNMINSNEIQIKERDIEELKEKNKELMKKINDEI